MHFILAKISKCYRLKTKKGEKNHLDQKRKQDKIKESLDQRLCKKGGFEATFKSCAVFE